MLASMKKHDAPYTMTDRTMLTAAAAGAGKRADIRAHTATQFF